VRCLSCRKWSFEVICPLCQEYLLTPSVSTRSIAGVDIISLFRYRSIDWLLLSKHHAIGYRIFRFFGRKYLRPFLQAFEEGLEDCAYLIPIDDIPSNGYSHTAVMAHQAATGRIKALYGVLRAKNRIRYSGQSLSFRLKNPREFIYTGPKGVDVILLDDIVTSGLTISQAHQVLTNFGVRVLFALTVADAREG